MANVVRLSLKDLPAALRQDLAQVRSRVINAARKTAEVGATIGYRNAPKAFFEIADGIVPQGLPNGARIRSTAPHSEAVEVGSRPHMPPVEPIAAWVKLRGMQGLEAGRGAKGAARAVKSMIAAHSSRRDTAIDVPMQVAWAIAMGIKKNGTKPTWFMQRTAREIVPLLDAYVTQFLAADADPFLAEKS